MPKKEARRELEELCLEVREEKVANTGDAPADTVAGVSPTQGLTEGDEVLLEVWEKPPPPPPSDEDDDGDDDKPGKGKGKGHGKKKD